MGVWCVTLAAEEYIYEYAKYLGLDYDKLVEEFNEFMFEYTSKIPTEVIERISKQKEDEEKNKGALSPYTIVNRRNYKKPIMIGIVVLLLILSIFVIFKIREDNNQNDIVLSALI